MKRIQISLLLSVVVFATGCPKYSPKVDFKNPNTLAAKINAYITEQNKLYIAALGSNPDRAKQIRNELIENALPYIDSAYMDFITDIQAGRDRQNYLMDLVELGASAAVGITNGERPLQIIGVALTAFRGGRRSLDLNFYKDQSTPILVSKMDGNRAKVRAAILEKQQKEVKDYPLGAAIGDLVEYYNAGTLVRAFTELQKDTAVQTRISENALAEAKRMLGVVGAPTVEQMQESQQNFELVRRITKVGDDADLAIEAERAKATATPPGTPIQSVITAQTTILNSVLADYRRLFDLISADPKLKPLLQQIPLIYSDGDRGLQQTFQDQLNRVQNNSAPTLDDYDSIILKLSDQISASLSKDPTLAGELKKILLTSKILKSNP